VANKKKVNEINPRKIPSKELQRMIKRQMELCFISTFLFDINNAVEQRKLLEEDYTVAFYQQRWMHIDFTKVGLLACFYSAIHHCAVPDIGYIPHYSQDYYPEFIVPVLEVLQECYDAL
jgi:ribosomal protein L25 (general stress protein Ctc)